MTAISELTAATEMVSAEDLVTVAREALLGEADALRLAAERLGKEIAEAVALIMRSGGKVVVTGVGKSGHVGQKIAATLCSTGTPAVFLHATEAVHGDLGLYTRGDPSILISKSGTTVELLRLVPILRRIDSPLIGIVGNGSSALAGLVDVTLDASVPREADPLDLAPTSSTTVALGLGDALAAALMHARSFSRLDFARFHPAGQLGRGLTMQVADVMHGAGKIAWVAAEDSLKAAVIAMTLHPLGAACVANADGRLAGMVTDGDVRRALQLHDDIRNVTVGDAMTRSPTAITPDATLYEAAQVMENRPSQISVLPVLDEDGRCLGLLRLHDIYQANLMGTR